MYLKVNKIKSALCLMAVTPVFGVAQAQIRHAVSMAPGGASIGAQAIATYTDSSQTVQRVLSNKVETIVAKVFAVTIDNGTRVQGVYGEYVYIGHEIANMGNADDSFVVKLKGALPAKVVSAEIYPDADGDIRPDPGSIGTDATAGLSTSKLASGGKFRFVIKLKLAAEPVTRAVKTDTAIDLTATSVSDSSVSAVGGSWIDIVRGAAFEVRTTQTGVLVNKGDAAEVKFEVANTGGTGGTVAVKQVFDSGDAAGLSYVKDSLTFKGRKVDGNPIDSKPAYVKYDETTKTMTAAFYMDRSTRGYLAFQALASAELPAGAERKLTMEYGKGMTGEGDGKPTGEIEGASFKSRPFTVKIHDVSSLAIESATKVVPAALGHVPFHFDAEIKNNGSRSDRVKLLVAHTGTDAAIQLVDERGLPLLDTDHDGMPDTGLLAPNASRKIRIKVTIPSTAARNHKFTLTAQSAQYDGSATQDFTLIDVKRIGVSVRKQGSMNDSFTEIVDPVKPHFVKLTVKNASALDIDDGERFTLDAKVVQGVGTVIYRNPVGDRCVAEGALIRQTSPLGKDATQDVCAQISALGEQSQLAVSFSATSQSDRAQSGSILGAFNSSAFPLAFDVIQQTGTVLPNASITYVYKLANHGATDVAENAVTVRKTSSPDDWPVRLYVDPRNTGTESGDGVLEIPVNGKVPAGIDVGKSLQILAVVTAPAAVLDGAKHMASMTAMVGGQGVTATAVTTVSRDRVAVKKTQALSVACGNFNPAAMAEMAVSAKPGQCVWYQVVVSNSGTAGITGLHVTDEISQHMKYQDKSLTAKNGDRAVTGNNLSIHGKNISVDFGDLSASMAATLHYQVRINDGN